jgi:hypothetical protein
MKTVDLSFRVFGKLTVINKVENAGKNTAWNCVCECGVKKSILTYNLLSGKSQSCGCVRGVKLGKFSKTHGESKTRLYGIYKGMKQRCNNENTLAFKYYGLKGIKLCDEWLSDFLTFKKWCYDNGYDDEKTIDRINSNDIYCPENCRWVSFEKQQNNKLNSFFLTINDEKLTIAEWAKRNNINKQTLYSKFYRLFKDLKLIDNELELTIKIK